MYIHLTSIDSQAFAQPNPTQAMDEATLEQPHGMRQMQFWYSLGRGGTPDKNRKIKTIVLSGDPIGFQQS